MSLTLTLKRGGGSVSGSGTDFTLDGTMAGGKIQTVGLKGDTYQKTLSGKNLLDSDSITGGYNGTWNATTGIFTSNTWTGGSWVVTYINFPAISISQEFTISMDVRLTEGSTGTFAKINDGNTNFTEISIPTASTEWQRYSYRYTPSSGYSIRRFLVQFSTITGSFEVRNMQIELGSTDTDYEPYVGGTASPNPDYPQAVEVVTGEQTITITDGDEQSQEYTVDLGSIELCKIDNYQDYIYKSGEDWFIHKETKKLDVSALTGWFLNNNTNFRTLTGISDIIFPTDNNTIGSIMSKDYTAQAANPLANGDYDYGIALGAASYISIRNKTISTVAAFETYLANNQIYAYVALATPTDTQITDDGLIANLEALLTARTYNGQTDVSVSSTNLLPAWLEITADTAVERTYTEVELGAPFTISDVEGKSQNTTLDGNVYVDWAYQKKSFSVDLFHLTPDDYAEIRSFYDYQFQNGSFPILTIPELDITNMPVYFEISNRNIINQCLLTDKLTLKFRETIQP